MNDADRYAYRVVWSQEDGEYVGTVAEMPSLSWLADTPEKAFDGIRSLAVEAGRTLGSSKCASLPNSIVGLRWRPQRSECPSIALLRRAWRSTASPGQC